MYVKYTWLPTATESQVRDDLISIITGATSSASMSASCDIANTQWIANTSPSNWTLHDAAPAAGQGGFIAGSSRVLRSLNTDGVTYKYAQIALTTQSISSSSLTIAGWENWNNTNSNTAAGAMYPGAVVLAHGGFNVTSSQAVQFNSQYPSNFVYTVPTSIYIFVTARYIVIAPSPSTAPTGGAAIFEFSRDTPATDITYPCHVTFQFSSNMYSVNSFGVSRIKKANTIGDLGQSVPVLAINGTNLASNSYIFSNIFNPTAIGGGSSITQLSPNLGAGEQLYTLTTPVIIGGQIGGSQSTILGKVQGGILTSHNVTLASTSMDEMTVSGSTYVITKHAGGLLLIPKA